VYGQNLNQLFADLSSRAEGINDWAKLPIPFKAVGTDIETGKMVVMDHGPLFLALRGLVGDPAYIQMPLWAVVYVIYAVLMLWLGAQLAAVVNVP